MKKAFAAITLCLLSLVLLIGSSTFAWLGDNGLFSEIGVKSYIHKSYFESGDGTAESPFEIKYPVQYYYFTWLQYMGYFNKTDPETGNIIQEHFFLSADLDMTGWVLPPVGTQDYPFLGSFDGRNHSINNLTVQNVDRATIQQAAEVMELNDIPIKDPISGVQIVGVFGVVGPLPEQNYSYDNSVNKIQNLRINNAVVTTQTSESLAGIAAGYVSSSSAQDVLSNVVVSGTSNINSSASSALSGLSDKLSEYTLVGSTPHTDSSVFVQNVSVKKPNIRGSEGDGNGGAIVEGTNNAGGNLEIKPNDDDGKAEIDKISSAISRLSSDSRVKVPGSSDLPDGTPSATFNRTIFYSADNITSQLKDVWLYRHTVSFDASGYRVINESKDTNNDWYKTKQPPDTELKEMRDFYSYWASIKGGSGKGKYIYFNGEPKSGGVSISEGQSIDSLSNCIWFKPQGNGICALAFLHTSNNTRDYMSVFRFKRDASGNIAAGTLQEIKFELSSNHGNNSVNYYSLNISQDEYEAGYEYVIGARAGSTGGYKAGFFYLMLAAADNSGGPGVIQGVLGSKYATYDTSVITTKSLDLPAGVSFADDPTAAFGINMQSTPGQRAYEFSSSNGIAFSSSPPVVVPPGSAGDVVISAYTEGTRTVTVRTITGFDEQGDIAIVMRKTVVSDNSGSVLSTTYESKVPNDGGLPAFTTLTSSADTSALEKYFSVAGAFNDEPLLNYHHRISDENSIIIPESAMTVTVSTVPVAFGPYTINTYAPAASLFVDYLAAGTAYNVVLSGS